jgi:SAM-dependent methyltransferase
MHEPPPACPICGGDSTFWVKASDHHYGIQGAWTAFRCTRCGHGFMVPMPDEAELSRYYSDDYYSYQPPRTDFTPSGLRHRRIWLLQHYLKYRRSYDHLSVQANPALAFFGWLFSSPFLRSLPDFKSGAKLLDYGCGSGAAVAFYGFLGWESEGIEIDRRATETARRAGIPVQRGSVDTLEGRSVVYDHIATCHCVEHVRDVRRLFRAFFSALKPGGTLTVEVPNGDSLAARRYVEAFYYLGLPVHPHSFSPKSIRLLAKEVGFERLALTTHSRFLTQTKSAALKWRGRYGRVTTGTFGSHNWFEGLCGVLDALYTYAGSSRTGCGDCLILSCQKPRT